MKGKLKNIFEFGGAITKVFAPRRRNNGLIIFHDEVSGFLRLSHHVKQALIFGKIKIKVNFRTASMGMRWHGVPYKASL